jgi:hypothetical protein
MRKPINRCPVCDGQLEPVKLRCNSCELSVEGRFPTSKLSLLSSEQQQFVEAFLVARGNIKEVEKELGISYPTVRKKLDEVIQALGYASEEKRLEQHEILDAVDRGEMSPQEGIALMKALQKP